jgi:hypothetical protein
MNHDFSASTRILLMTSLSLVVSASCSPSNGSSTGGDGGASGIVVGSGGASSSGGAFSNGGAVQASGGSAVSSGGSSVSSGGASASSGGVSGGSGAGTGGVPAGDAGVYTSCVNQAVTNGNTAACASCLCDNCLTQLNACTVDNDPPGDGDKCKAVINCAGTSHCVGEACYCNNPPAGGACTMGGGPCQAQIDATATNGDPKQLSTDGTTVGHPLYNARAVGACATSKCAAECN